MPEREEDFSFETKAVHAGELLPSHEGRATATPIYASTTFTYDTMREMEEVFDGARDGYVYTRHGNPTLHALEEAVRKLEGGAGACSYASGMAALHAALIACELKPGSSVIASQDLYGATSKLLREILSPFDVRIETADFADAQNLRELTRALNPRALLVETISNPLLKVCDVDMCANVAREFEAALIVDNTFASPYLARPLELGADLVVHSATKFLGGHGDATGGVVVARSDVFTDRLVKIQRLVGGVLSVWEAHEILRGLKTLALRLERQSENAAHLAAHLKRDSRVSRVHYPTLAAGERGEIAARTLRKPHGGALVTIELKDDTRAAAFRFMDALRLCVRSTSLGDVFTGVLHPATASHRDMPQERRRELGVTEGLIRISVGIEDIGDVVRDIDRALEA